MAAKMHELRVPDGHTIRIYDWCPAGKLPDSVIQILHGLGEHAGRYQRFAGACNAENIAVVAHDHRGHGVHEGFGHYADNNGWTKVISDVLRVRQRIADQYPQVPVVLLGHSMGSYIAQSVVIRHGGNNVGLILSASTFASRRELRVAHVVARVLAAMTGGRRINHLLNHAGLGKFNRAFEPTRTESDWLSRDEVEVDSYLADPFCGGEFSNRLWSDLTGGLLEITTPKAIASIRHDLPILILGGENDPVGGRRGLGRLADVFNETGHDNLTLKVYAGGRHEMLNETNRDEVTADVIHWIKTI